jgi:hypothetical protein
LSANAIIRLSRPNGIRFQQQQHAPRGRGIQVIFTTDIMDKIMATDHLSKDTTRPRFDEFVFLKLSLNSAFLLLVFGKGLAIDQKYPIEITSRINFSTSDGTKNH